MGENDERTSDCYVGRQAGAPGEREPLPAGDTAARPPCAPCVLCGEPTEYGAAHPGVTLCPICEWQEAQRTACSG